MSSLHNAGIPHNDGRSKAFLLGLYFGLSLLLLLVSYLDPDPISPLHKATNIYGLQALAGAVLGFWRIYERADNPRKTPALASVWICFGLVVWAIAQGVWTWAAFTKGAVPYPGWSDIFYIASDVSWLVALFYVFKSLRRDILAEISPFTAILTAALSLLIGFFVWLDRSLINEANPNLIKLACDLVYILLTFSSMMLAVALVLGKGNAEIPFPIHQCIRYLCAATAINAGAILAFTVTENRQGSLAYVNGDWVDWLLLTAMYLWGVSALKCPIREEELRYIFGTTRSEMRVEDIYRAGEIAESYCQDAHETERVATYLKSTEWILDAIPGCWRVVKLGGLVVGSTFLFPVPRHLMDAFGKGRMKECELFEEVKKSPLTWECLYLADASILVDHRRRGLALKCFKTTIENIATEHKNPQIEVYCWPNSPERKMLAEKLKKHVKEGIRVIPRD